MKKYEKENHGIVFKNFVFMIDGYISEFSLDKKDKKNYKMLLQKKGYVADNGDIYIYRNPNEKGMKGIWGLVPWFTVDKSNGKPEYVFHEATEHIQKEFREELIGDWSYRKLVHNIHQNDKLYDEDVINELNASTSVFIPEIKETDGFLKRLVKEIIIRKKVNIAKYLPMVPKKYILSNWKQGLSNDSKMSELNFINWCELMGITVHIIIENNGRDTDPLPSPIYYNSETDTIEEINESVVDKIKKGK